MGSGFDVYHLSERLDFVSDVVTLLPNIIIFLPQHVDMLIQSTLLIIGFSAELFDDLEHTPETQHYDQRPGFFQRPSKENIDDKSCHDHSRIKTRE